MNIKKITAALSALAIVMTSAAFSTSAETEPLLYGDATCDSEVDVRDITAVNQHIVKLVTLSEQGIKNCDLFGTGDVTLKDLGQMKKYMINMVETLEPQISEAELSAEVITLPPEALEGSALYKSADELPDEISMPDGFFDENYLYVERITTVNDDNISFTTSVTTEEDGSLTVDVVQKLTSLLHTDEGVLKYCVAVTIPKSMYTGQDINVNLSETVQNQECSAEVITLPPEALEDSALYKSADELPDEISMPDGFFDENYLYVKRITVCDDDCNFSASVTTGEDGSLNVNVIQKFLRPFHAEVCALSYCVAVTIPESMYTGQDINISITEESGGIHEAFVIKDVNMFLDLYNNPSLLEPKIFTNYEDFKEYIDEMYISVYTTDGECYTSSAPEELYKYDEDFFKDNALLIKMSEQPINVTSIKSSTISMNTEGKFKAYVNMEFKYNVDSAQYPTLYFVGAEISAEECRNVLTEFEVEEHMLFENNIYSDFAAIECGYTGEHLSEGKAYTSKDKLPDIEGLEKYDDEFFESNVLYIRYEPFSSGSITPVPKSVEINQYGNFILNVYDKTGIESTDDMNGYYLCFSLPKYIYSGQRLVDVVHDDAFFDNSDETDSDAEISVDVIQNPDSLDTDDFVNFLNPEGIYSTEIITDSESFKKHIVNSSEELEKYNDEFFENNNAVIFKYNSYAYVYDFNNIKKFADGSYNVYFDQICYDCIGYDQNCAVMTVPKSVNADSINIIFNNIQ